MMLRVYQWYGSRTAREQLLLVAMAAIAVALFAWLLVARPIANAHDKALERHLEAVDRNGRVLALAEKLKSRPGVDRASRNVDIQLVVSEAAGLAGLTLANVAPSGSDGVSVTLADAAAPVVAEWLRSLEARGVSVEEVRMTPAAEGGVDVSARLSRR